jgi:hypothetical protein
MILYAGLPSSDQTSRPCGLNFCEMIVGGRGDILNQL